MADCVGIRPYFLSGYYIISCLTINLGEFPISVWFDSAPFILCDANLETVPQSKHLNTFPPLQAFLIIFLLTQNLPTFSFKVLSFSRRLHMEIVGPMEFISDLPIPSATWFPEFIFLIFVAYLSECTEIEIDQRHWTLTRPTSHLRCSGWIKLLLFKWASIKSDHIRTVAVYCLI